MPIYRIADINMEYFPKYKQTAEQLKPYEVLDSEPELFFEVSEDDMQLYQNKEGARLPMYLLESTALVNKVYDEIFNKYNGFFFHSSCLMLNGEAYVFSAASGTGKSTHTALWRKKFGERVTMINDDKPVIRLVNGKFYIYGTPWMGKSSIGSNIKAPVKAVYFLRQAKENSARRVSVGEVFTDVMSATSFKRTRENTEKLLALLDGFFSTVQVFELNCNISLEAVDTAYNAANT